MTDEILNPYKKFLKKTDEENKRKEILVDISIENLIPFKDNKFRTYSEEEMKDLKDSINLIGLQNPIIVRSIDNNKYEILAGHNRVQAFKELGIKQIPSIIKDVDDDTAKMIMIDTNIVQRQKMNAMERARVYKVKDEIKKRKKYSVELVEENLTEEEKKLLNEEETRQTFYRYLSLNNLIPEYQNKCESGLLSVKAGEQLAKLNIEQQKKIYECLGDINISNKKATELKKLALTLADDLSDLNIKECFYSDGNKTTTLKFSKEEMEKYFYKFKTIQEIKKYILEILNLEKTVK